MANIYTELTTISNNRYGEQVRWAIHDAIEKINLEGADALASASGNVDEAKKLAQEAANEAKKLADEVAAAKSKMDYYNELYKGIGEWAANFSIQDTGGSPITDENGNQVEGQIIFIIKK